MNFEQNNIDIILEHITSLLTTRYDSILLNQLGVSYSQYKVLSQFSENIIIRQKTIAENLGQSEASISRQLKIMNNRGLISKSYDPDNKKTIIINLTLQGLRIKKSADGIIQSQNVRTLDKINLKDQTKLLANLNKIHLLMCSVKHNL